MTRILSIFVIIFFSNISLAEISNETRNKYFYIGKMKSYNNEFTLYFKTRDKAILARGEETNYINDFPQDLYIYNHNSKEDLPLLTYDWFPKKVKNLSLIYSLPVFPEDYAYYLLNDNETLIMISGIKSINSNFKFNLKKNKLEKLPNNNQYKLFVSSLLKDCGYKDINSTYKCSFYKPLISENLIK